MADSAVRGLMATRTKAAPKKPAAEPKTNSGKVVQVIGPVLDVEFEPERLPELYNALVIDYPDEGDPIPAGAERWPIHRETPKFVDLEPKTEVFETGIKVIDLVAPFVKGGK